MRLLKIRIAVMLLGFCMILIVLGSLATPTAAIPPSPPNDTPPSVFLAADPTVIFADGTSTATINASVWDGFDWIWIGPLVNFSTDLGVIDDSARITNGVATVTLTAGTVPGVANISAETNLSDYGILTTSTTVTFTTIEFHTGAGDYPSISGVLRGTIKPAHSIVAERISAYPCAGTGGHFESVTFYNATTKDVVANATWDGYLGDYHKLTFSERFVLAGGTEYTYEIVTGSYPRMIHRQNLTTSDGNLTCTSFIDVNGIVHDDWLPAFTLGL